MRTLWGFLVAWATASAVGFIGGCVHAIMIMNSGRYGAELTRGAASGQGDALGVFLFVGGISAAVAASLSLLVIILVALPLYVVSVRRHGISSRLYVSAGIGIAVLLIAGVFSFQHAFAPLPLVSEYYLEVAMIVVGVLAGMSVFWAIARPNRFT